MKIDPVAEQPRVLPLLVGFRTVNVLQYVPRVGALLDAIEPHCAEFFSEYAPSPQYAIAIRLEVDCCTCLIGEAGLLVKLNRDVNKSTAYGYCTFLLLRPFLMKVHKKYIPRLDAHSDVNPAQQKVHQFLLLL